MAIDLIDLIATAEVVVTVENLVTLRDEVLIYVRWHNSAGCEVFPSSFIVVEI